MKVCPTCAEPFAPRQNERAYDYTRRTYCSRGCVTRARLAREQAEYVARHVRFDGDRALCTITQKTGRSVVIVLDADCELATAHRWHLSSGGYAVRARPVRGSGRLYLHREIVGLDRDDPRSVDHINGDQLDNRRANLRVATHAENMQNRALSSNNRTGARGVYFCKRRRRYIAKATVGGRVHYLGSFTDVADADRAATAFRREHMPFSVADQVAA
jgi:hypothetical protein